ncbi:dolichol kinase EVAN [Dendrobium catenatum]|uniref:dolichol kinase n=1 Tax=Dendrobium catenatum TaxID=906689 RepID=A0A2I0X3I5_9ASPA|nr:dolichol kinase EVAN [Dendrobium catenatum]PKU82479.1 dolichol kinase [Dendrobium catenatum]
MAGAFELFNGERVVVFLFVSRILFTVPFSFAYESAALVLLAIAGVLVEISIENSSALDCYKNRSGAASGILLATVTLPSLMLSRMIQMSRAISNHEVGPEWLSYFSLQFWAACSCCFAVVSFLSFILKYSCSSTNSLHLRRAQASKYSLFCMVVYGLLCYHSLDRKSSSDWYVVMNLLWLFCYGLTTMVLLKHILCTFPSSASIGEGLLVSNGIVLYFGDLLANVLSKMKLTSESTIFDFLGHDGSSEISTIIQGGLTGLLLFPLFYKLSLQMWELTICSSVKVQAVDRWIPRVIGSSVFFYASLSLMLTILVPALIHFTQDFAMHPLLWVLNFLFTEPLRRISLCFYWIVVLCVSVFRFYNISKNSKTERILLRKYYHLVAVLIFVPGVIFEPAFLDLAFGAALAAFLILEMMRVWSIWPFGHMVHQFMNAFTDHRDSEILIVSHFSLLLGCAIPKWMSSGFNDRPLSPFAGILSLGIGDTMASMVGHKYGVLRWSKTGKKTIEGTAAGITSVLASCSLLLPLLASTGSILSQHWFSLVVAVTLTGLLEAYTTQLDNAFIPLVFYSLLCL